MNQIIDAEILQAQKDKRKEQIRPPLTYADIKDDPFYYNNPPEPEAKEDD